MSTSNELATIYDPQVVGLTGMRIHELALQRWFYHNFFIQAATYPIPVIFNPPRLAFAEFNRLWQGATNPQNPFNYLTRLVDEHGTPLYEPYPSNVRYPLITVRRLGTRYRTSQSYTPHRYRRLFWPTVSSDVVRQQLGYVAQAQMPSAWDYRFQVSFFCRTPEMLAYFNSRLHSALKVSAGDAQTFIVGRYPFHNGPQYLRLYLDGSIDDVQPDAQPESYTEYQTSFNLVIEGYNVYFNMQYVPTFWRLAVGQQVVSPEVLERIFDFNTVEVTEDLRNVAINPVVDSTVGIPVPATGTNANIYDNGSN